MEILTYNALDPSKVKKQFDKVVENLRRDDFYSAEVKKLVGTPYYRAKLDYSHRLLFKIVAYEGKKYALLLEIILHHAYDKSRFLRGASVIEAGIEKDQTVPEPLGYVNLQNPYFHVLDKMVSFDPLQESIFNLHPPFILIGSAGSGKTLLTLEKMKDYSDDILYVTGSPYLVQNARNLYYAHHYNNDAQTIDFLSYREFMETLQVPEGKEMDFARFAAWARSLTKGKLDPHTLYEEFKGVLTGNRLDTPYLSQEDYLSLGVKQSIYSLDERASVYTLFERYRRFLQDHHYYDTNLVSYHYLAHCPAKYALIVVDEVQDFTPVQLALILKSLRVASQFILCGDANQIVHPNFFSWAKMKSLFYTSPTEASSTILMRILHKNYRNAVAVTALANQVLKVKRARFGSIDKESHYLVESQSTAAGEVYCLLNQEDLRQEINTKTAQSTRFAILVLEESQKEEAGRYFQTPLIFSIYEAKGLEYDHVILYNFITTQEKKFRAIAEGVSTEDLHGEFTYRRVKDKTDRSLERYKFYINAFYVAITRAIQNVYVLEDLASHPFLSLLGLTPSMTLTTLERQTSSRDEWQKEMQRLALQGKQAQAEAIRTTRLETKPLPWQVLTPDALTALHEKALSPVQKDKTARLLLFEYALVYRQSQLLLDLITLGFPPANRPEKGRPLLEQKYFLGYTSTHPRLVLQQVALYGVDFRNPFNQTPLMVASHFGNAPLTQTLLEKGANPYLTDNFGRTAFQLALQNAFLSKKMATHRLAMLYDVLPPDTLNLQVNGKLIKIDVQQMAFYLVNGMVAMTYLADERSTLEPWLLNVNDFMQALQPFPETVVPERRKRRAYLSALLAKNEVNRQDPYNRQLFIRAQHGYYMFNPELKMKVGEEWVNLTSLLSVNALIENKRRHLVAHLNKLRRNLDE